MSTVVKYHWSPRLQRWSRCVAVGSCPYGGAHTDLAGIARAGGADLSRYGHETEQKVSALFEDAYSIGTDNRQEVYRTDGTKLTRIEREQWQAKRAAHPGEPATPVPAQPKGRHSDPRDHFLAENSTDPGILGQLANSDDWHVRLLVARNPATATDTLEQLALTTDKNARLYRAAVRAELGHRYQDLRDEAEVKAYAQMASDPKRSKWLEDKPNNWMLSATPAVRWQRKPVKVRRSIIQAAMEETAKALGLAYRFSGLTRSAVAQPWSKAASNKLFRLPKELVHRSTRSVLGFIADFFVGLAGDAKAQRRIANRIGFGW